MRSLKEQLIDPKGMQWTIVDIETLKEQSVERYVFFKRTEGLIFIH